MKKDFAVSDINYPQLERTMWGKEDTMPTDTNGLDSNNIHFPAEYGGMRQKPDGDIVLTLLLDASQWDKLSPLGSDWKDRGLLVAMTPATDEPIAG